MDPFEMFSETFHFDDLTRKHLSQTNEQRSKTIVRTLTVNYHVVNNVTFFLVISKYDNTNHTLLTIFFPLSVEILLSIRSRICISS